MLRYHAAFSMMGVFALSLALGCGDGGQAVSSRNAAGGAASHKEDGHADEHHHDSHGPHGGELVELGKGKFHLEMIHDDAAGTVSVFVLDTSAKEVFPIAGEEVQLNLVVDGKPRQFVLAAAAQPSDPPGKSSCFRSADKELCDGLDAKGTTARFVVMIDDKPYSGVLSGAHDHQHVHRE